MHSSNYCSEEMNEARNEFMPRVRKDGLVVRELSGELLVYDRERNKAHGLNETAAMIWLCCDGQTTISEMRARLEDLTKTPFDEQSVWYALNKFSRNALLEQPVKPSAGGGRLSRRKLIQTIGVAASISMVVSIIAPNVFAAASCIQICTSPAQCTIPGCPVCSTLGLPGVCQA